MERNGVKWFHKPALIHIMEAARNNEETNEEKINKI